MCGRRTEGASDERVMSRTCDVHETGASDRPSRVRRRRGEAPHDRGGIARRARGEQVGVGHERARRVKYREGGGSHMEGRNMVTMAVASGIVVPTSGITKLEPTATGEITVGDEGAGRITKLEPNAVV